MNKTTHAIYGKAKYRNGIITPWLQFIDSRLTHAEAEKEAIRIVSATFPTDEAWVTPYPPDAPPCTECTAR